MALSLRAMEYFTTALRRGNIARAAVELNIAASAVSTAIDQVEDAFGLTLVTRQRSRGIRANASGLAIARKCERLLDDYRAMLAEGTDLRQSLSGTLRIGYYAPVAPAFLPGILASFVPASGDVELYLEECDNDGVQEGLLRGLHDVILFVSEDVHPSIDFEVLVEAPPYCLVSSSHRLARRRSVNMAELAKEALVVLNRPVAAAYYRGLFGAQAQNISIAAHANSTEMVRSLVSAGHGCAILNMKPLMSTSYTGATVVELPISDPLPPLRLAMAYDKSRPRRLVRHFVDACRDHFASASPQRCIVA